MIPPNIAPERPNQRGNDIRSFREAIYAEAIAQNQVFWSEADCDTRTEAGDVSVYPSLYGNLPNNRRTLFNFNHVRRIVEMVSGQQRSVRKSTIAVPVENANQETADQFTKVLMSLNRQQGVLETISDAFHGALVTGLSFLQVWIDYRNDPINGDIKVDKCDYNTFLVDPFFKKRDLSDCNYLWKRSYLTKAECISLLPDYAEEIEALPYNDSGSGRDGKFQFTAESYNYAYKNLMTYDEIYYRDYRDQELLVDTYTGEFIEWKNEDKATLKAILARHPQLELVKNSIPTVNLAIFVQDKLIFDGPNPLGIDTYPFIPVFGYYNPQLPYYQQRIMGIVRNLRDAQFLFNRRKVIELDIYESQVTSGWVFKEDALVNPADVFLTGQGRGIALKSTAQITDIQRIMAPSLDPSTLEVSDRLAKELMQISGINEELLGAAQDDKSGILSMLRQSAGLKTLGSLFDGLDYSQKLLGRLLVSLIQTNYTPSKIKRLIQEEPTQEFYSKVFGKYDVSIEEGLNTSSQKQMQFAQMVQLREVGLPISGEMLFEASTMQNKKQIMEQIAQAEKAQQEQAQIQQQVQMQLQQAQIDYYHSKGQSEMGLAVERNSRVIDNQSLAVERLHQANAADERAALDKVKALKELQDMDLEHLARLVQLAQSLKGSEMSTAEQGLKNVASTGSATPPAPTAQPQ